MEARELVADAALGLVDSLDLLGLNDAEGTAVLYHHLLNCGLRLAATAGTDVWLSFSRGSLISNPPGWARVYADLRGARLSVAAFQEAIRAGRTMATTGPWLELAVDGRGPGDVLDAVTGQRVAVSIHAQGLGIERLELIGPDGVPGAPLSPRPRGVRAHQPGACGGRRAAGPPPGQRAVAAGLARPGRALDPRPGAVRGRGAARRGRRSARSGTSLLPGAGWRSLTAESV